MECSPAEQVMWRAYWRRWRTGRKIEAGREAARACGVTYQRLRWALMGHRDAIALPQYGADGKPIT